MLVDPEWRISVVCVVSVLEGGKVEGVGIENILFIDSRCPQSAGCGRQQSSVPPSAQLARQGQAAL